MGYDAFTVPGSTLETCAKRPLMGTVRGRPCRAARLARRMVVPEEEAAA
ncbi:MAG: hypothetical protein U1F45_02015 [Burkholderiales bacterium]